MTDPYKTPESEVGLEVDKLKSKDHAAENVVFDKNCVTSKGAGTSIEFALSLLAVLMGEAKMKEVAKGMALDV